MMMYYSIDSYAKEYYMKGGFPIAPQTPFGMLEELLI